jgi:hypothetical protein
MTHVLRAIQRVICTTGFAATVAFGGHAVAETVSASGALALSEAELSAEWWQSVLSIPAGVNPLFDLTGERCMVGQRGAIWFLHGAFTGTPVVRNCVVPEGKVLFFPVINNVVLNTPNMCFQAGPMTAAELRAQVAPFIDAASNLSAAVDGHPVPMRRVRSLPFAAVQPADNIFVDPCGGPSQQPAGVYSPGVDDGYYVLLAPLPKGQHTVRVLATSGSFSIDVTYNLTIAPISLR